MTWYLDGRTIAKKVRDPAYGVSAGNGGSEAIAFHCETCGQAILERNNNIAGKAAAWPGLPAGVKFDPSDQELLGHLAAKRGQSGSKSHPLIDEFIPTLLEEDGICYTHPANLPGARPDGSSIHFFHKSVRAYTTGNRKRRKVQTRDGDTLACDIRWHKTGKTRPILDDGKKQVVGCKKIMVLYTAAAPPGDGGGRSSKPTKSNWVIHQYHLGAREDEDEGQLVVSKVFYQTQPRHSSSASRTQHGDVRDHHHHPHPADSVAAQAAATKALLFSSANTFDAVNLSSLAAAPPTPETAAPHNHGSLVIKPSSTKGLFAILVEDVNRINAALSLQQPKRTVDDAAQIRRRRLSDESTSPCFGFDCSFAEGTQAIADLFIERKQPDLPSSHDHGSHALNRMEHAPPMASGRRHLRGMPGLESHPLPDAMEDSYAADENAHQRDHNDGAGDYFDGRRFEDHPPLQERKVDSILDNIDLDTPPEMLLESINSQESDWLGKRKFWSDSSSQKASGSEDGGMMFLEFIKDSQGSS